MATKNIGPSTVFAIVADHLKKSAPGGERANVEPGKAVRKRQFYQGGRARPGSS